MKNQIITILNEQLNLDISYSSPRNDQSNSLKIRNNDLKKSILADMEKNIGSHVLKLSLPIEKYARYKNNTVSSIIRKNGVIKEHVGHQDIKIADIVDRIFYDVNNHYIENVFKEFYDFVNKVQLLSDETQKNIINTIHATEQNIINTINHNFEREYLNELSSITEFFEEMYEDIGEISASKDRCNAYLNHIIGNLQKALKLINHFLDRLRIWPNQLLQRDLIWEYIPINYNALANDYLVCRQAVSNYVVCLVFEYVLSGNIDEKSQNKIIQKVERISNKFSEADNAIQNSLKQRYNDNRQNYQWYSSYQDQFKSNDQAGIYWFITECAKDEYFEVKEVRKLFSRSQHLLGNIIIE